MTRVSPRLLVIQHEDQCPLGLLGPWLSHAGVEVDIVRGHRGDDIPVELTDHDGLVVLGGEMGALDDDVAPWLPAVRSLIAGTVTAGRPFLGVCLGHQLAGVALGGRISRNPRGQATGVTPFDPTSAGSADPLFGTVAPGAPAVQWNADVVTALPPEARVLAYAPDGSVQAVRFGPVAWGVQAHPEVGAAIFRSWTTEKPSAHRLRADGVDMVAAAQEIEHRGPEMARAWEAFGHRFAQIVTEAAVRPDGGLLPGAPAATGSRNPPG